MTCSGHLVQTWFRSGDLGEQILFGVVVGLIYIIAEDD